MGNLLMAVHPYGQETHGPPCSSTSAAGRSLQCIFPLPNASLSQYTQQHSAFACTQLAAEPAILDRMAFDEVLATRKDA